MFLLAPVSFGGGRLVTWGFHPSGDEFKTEMTAVSAGFIHSLALTTSGVVVAWGDNTYGQATTPDVSNIKQISAGGYHSLAITKSGSVIGWGLNDDGQATPPKFFSKSCVSVAAGMFHSLALHKSGFVLAWGYNDFGQTDVPLGLWGVAAISAGAMHSVALRSDGMVFAWGDDAFGQCRVPDEALREISSISAGYFHTLALNHDGRVIAWGDNSYGQCDVPPEALENVIAVSAGQTHSMALKADGTMIMWGGAIGVPEAAASELTYKLTAVSAGGYHSLGLIDADRDANENGIPDWWEIRYGLVNSLGADSDYDGDGFSDLVEYQSDTNPTDGDANFSIQIVPNEDGSCDIVYGPVSIERVYTLEQVDDIASSTWKPVKGHTRIRESASAESSRMKLESATSSGIECRIFRVIVNKP